MLARFSFLFEKRSLNFSGSGRRDRVFSCHSGPLRLCTVKGCRRVQEAEPGRPGIQFLLRRPQLYSRYVARCCALVVGPVSTGRALFFFSPLARLSSLVSAFRDAAHLAGAPASRIDPRLPATVGFRVGCVIRTLRFRHVIEWNGEEICKKNEKLNEINEIRTGSC